MRVNQRMRQTQVMQPQKSTYQQQNSVQSSPQATFSRTETAAMQLARKIKTEQGEKYAGYFLYAVRPYVAPGEISHIESTLSLHAEQNPDVPKSQKGGNMNMLKLLMQFMQGKSPDPMSLLRMMSG